MTQQEIEFLSLLDRNSQVINKACWLFCKGDKDRYDDLRQEVFFRFWVEYRQYGLSRFRHECAESTWVFRLSINALSNYHRDIDRRQSYELQPIHQLDRFPAETNLEDITLIDEVMERLDDRERRYLVYFMEKIPYKEVASCEGIPVPLVQGRMFRLIRKIKRMVKPQNNESHESEQI